MQINGLGPAGTPTQGQKITEHNSFLGPNDFFQILAAQLKYQDPMSGGDHGEHIMQMSQFAMIEKMDHLVKSMENLYNLNATGYALNLIGRTVTLDTLEQGTVTSVIEKMEMTREGIHYWMDGQRFERPGVLKVLADQSQDAVEKGAVHESEDWE